MWLQCDETIRKNELSGTTALARSLCSISVNPRNGVVYRTVQVILCSMIKLLVCMYAVGLWVPASLFKVLSGPTVFAGLLAGSVC